MESKLLYVMTTINGSISLAARTLHIHVRTRRGALPVPPWQTRTTPACVIAAASEHAGGARECDVTVLGDSFAGLTAGV